MKICIINSFYYPDIVGGAEVSVLKLAEQLYKDGNEVYVLCTSDKNKKEVINGVNIFRIKVGNICNPIDVCNKVKKINYLKLKMYYLLDKFNILNFNILLESLKQINPDVVHINNIYGISPVIWGICKKIDIPIVQTLRDYSLLSSKDIFMNKIKRKFYSFLSKDINIVTAPSKYTLDKFVENGYFRNSKKEVIYNSIDYLEEDVSRVLSIKKNNISCKDKTKYVYLGRLEKEKGIEYLINCFQKIKNPKIELLIAGKGECENYVINVSKYDSRIKYIGFINEKEIEDLLTESDVLVIPSLWPEPFGRVIIEAYKFSMPVIGTINGGIPEIIINNKTGILVSPNSEKELINAIQYLSNKNNRFKFIEGCSTEVNKYNIKNQSKQFLMLYNSII